eukprot:4457864-Pleurochrysis_carterae.AAC.1
MRAAICAPVRASSCPRRSPLRASPACAAASRSCGRGRGSDLALRTTIPRSRHSCVEIGRDATCPSARAVSPLLRADEMQRARRCGGRSRTHACEQNACMFTECMHDVQANARAHTSKHNRVITCGHAH